MKDMIIDIFDYLNEILDSVKTEMKEEKENNMCNDTNTDTITAEPKNMYEHASKKDIRIEILDFIAKKKTFSIHDITKSLRANEYYVKHDKVKEVFKEFDYSVYGYECIMSGDGSYRIFRPGAHPVIQQLINNANQTCIATVKPQSRGRLYITKTILRQIGAPSNCDLVSINMISTWRASNPIVISPCDYISLLGNKSEYTVQYDSTNKLILIS